MYRFILVVFLYIFSSRVYASKYFMMDQVKLLNSSFVEGVLSSSEMRVTKFDRFTYGINAKFALFIDFDENIFLEVQHFWKPSNSYAYSKTKFQFRRLPFPVFFQTYILFFKPVFNAIQNYSNIPPLVDNQRYTWKKVIMQSFVPIFSIQTDAFCRAHIG